MANPGYVRSADGLDTDTGATWALANATLTGAMADALAGDRIWVSQAHAESTASSITLTSPGTPASPCQILCGNDAAEPPTALAATGAVSTTGASNITINGSLYCEGLIFSAASGASNGQITLAGTDANAQHFKGCSFRLNTTSTTPRITIGATAAGAEGRVAWENCTVKFGSISQTIALNRADFRWSGGSVESGGSSPVDLFSPGQAGVYLIESVDLSNLAAGVNLTASTGFSGRVTFRNCKLPAAWSGVIATPPTPGGRAEMFNCSATDTNYALWIADYAGTIKHETTLVKTGGATDGTTPISWNMSTSANAEYPLTPLDSPEIYSEWIEVVGSSLTASVEILHDSLTLLKNDEVWLEVQYLGTSGVPLSTTAKDCKSTIIAVSQNQIKSAAAWTTTGLTNPNKQRLEVAFTPQEKGVAICRIRVAKASYTVFVDPKVTVDSTLPYAYWNFEEGSGTTIKAISLLDNIPDFTFGGTLGWATASAVTTAATGNVMAKVYQNAAVDELFRLNNLTGASKCFFVAMKLKFNILPANASRGAQIGDQGSALGQKGGFVFRWNGTGSVAPFNQHCCTLAIHTPYNAALGDKVGGQSSPNFVDPIVTEPNPVVAGTIYTYILAVDASRAGANYYAMIYRDGVFQGEDVSFDPENYPLPGISDVEINGSSGLRFFAQSDTSGQSPLIDATVYDMWVGRARDTAHLASIATAFHADSTAYPM